MTVADLPQVSRHVSVRTFETLSARPAYLKSVERLLPVLGRQATDPLVGGRLTWKTICNTRRAGRGNRQTTTDAMVSPARGLSITDATTTQFTQSGRAEAGTCLVYLARLAVVSVQRTRKVAEASVVESEATCKYR